MTRKVNLIFELPIPSSTVPIHVVTDVFLSHHSTPGKLRITAYDHTHCQFALISTSPQSEIESKIGDPAVYGNFPEFKKVIKRQVVRAAAQRMVTKSRHS